MSDDDPLIGRDAELATLEGVLSSARPGLVLVVGGPRTGKARLLRELRARCGAYPCTLVPPDMRAEEAAPWIVIDKQLTVDDFRRATARASDDVAQQQMRRRNIKVILLYGYRPDEDFHEWFTREFVPGLADPDAPCVVVVAGNAGDVAALTPLAKRQVLLGPLPRDAVVAELRAIDARLTDRLQEGELDVYADAITTDPSVLGALRHLLPLTRTSRRENGTEAEASR